MRCWRVGGYWGSTEENPTKSEGGEHAKLHVLRGDVSSGTPRSWAFLLGGSLLSLGCVLFMFVVMETFYVYMVEGDQSNWLTFFFFNSVSFAPLFTVPPLAPTLLECKQLSNRHYYAKRRRRSSRVLGGFFGPLSHRVPSVVCLCRSSETNFWYTVGFVEIFVLDKWSVSVDEDERHFLSCHQKLVSNPKKEKSIVFRGEKLAGKKKGEVTWWFRPFFLLALLPFLYSRHNERSRGVREACFIDLSHSLAFVWSLYPVEQSSTVV